METKTKIYGKLLTFQNEVEVIKKDGKNSFFKKANGKESTYATLTNILAEVKPILNALKLVVTQPIINGEVYTIVTDTESGEEVTSSVPLPSNLNAQQIGSAITYFRRYTISSLLSLEIDEDDDGNKASKPPVKTEAEKVEAAKAVLVVATKNNFGSLWKTLSEDMKSNTEILEFGKTMTEKLGITKKQAA